MLRRISALQARFLSVGGKEEAYWQGDLVVGLIYSTGAQDGSDGHVGKAIRSGY